MMGQDPTRRFDYLFEPLNGVGADEITDDAVPSAAGQSDAEPRRLKAAPNRFVLAAIVLAATAAAATTVILLLEPENSGRVDPPIDPLQVATTEPQAPSQPVLVVPPAETDHVNEPPDETAIVEPQPPQPEPSTAGGEPDLHDRPATRAPISVEPTPRQLFPNQGPRGGGGQSPSSPAGVPGSESPSDGHGHGAKR
jgi:hypothetical protein